MFFIDEATCNSWNKMCEKISGHEALRFELYIINDNVVVVWIKEVLPVYVSILGIFHEFCF